MSIDYLDHDLSDMCNLIFSQCHTSCCCCCCCCCCHLNQNLNTSRPSEYPPVRGQKISKRLDGIIGCRDRLFLTFSDLVANPKMLLYTVAHPAAHGLLNREKGNKKRKPGSSPDRCRHVPQMFSRCPEYEFYDPSPELRTFLEASCSWNIKEMCMHAQAMQPMLFSRGINGVRERFYPR